MSYDFKNIEKKWKDTWEKNPIAQTKSLNQGKKYYCLDMFPYPSGTGLHVGHWRNYVLSDVYARIKWLQGFNILHPIGWDAFGLPAENDAIKKGIHPKISVAKNIANFTRQLKEIETIYDWSKEINTTDPEYYKWTQWIFIQMYKAGLAYQSEMPINWCPSCLTGLANEEVVDGGCERCGTKVEQKKLTQWMLKITAYAEKLLDGLDKLEWSDKVKLMQRNWIGKSEGAQIKFRIGNETIEVFTTRPDTIYGVTFLVMAPDHDLVEKISVNKKEIEEYKKQISLVGGLEGMIQKDKTGVFTGAYAINPINNAQIPVYVSNYVLKGYGTGIIMAVPAHDQRDYDFAKKFNLPIKKVVESSEEVYEADGPLINCGEFNGLDAKTEGNKQITQYLIDKGLAHKKVIYKLRDWVFSRQRYWGEPIPVIHCKKCGVVPVPEEELPVRLPDVESYKPTGTGESPLAAINDWVNVACPKCKGPGRRETNTMPQWAGSSWYFLRYPNPNLEDKPFDKDDMKYWLPVDLYIGGIEHAILHLLYARFYTKFLYDIKCLPFDEPFSRLFNQGMICKFSEKTGLIEKMSKSKGNVVNPDDLTKEYGVDALRLYELFMGPPEADCEWQDNGIEGMNRFLNRLWNFFADKNNIVDKEEMSSTRKVHKFLKEFQERLDDFKTNTAIASFMEWLNDHEKISKASAEKILVSLSIMAPNIASELLEIVLGKKIEDCKWPEYDTELARSTQVTIAIQVNGKLRGEVQATLGATQDVVQPMAEKVAEKWLGVVVRVVFVSNRLINFVVK